MRLVLDTHIWLRWLSSDLPLDDKIVQAIEEAEYLAVSSISCWEVAYLVKRQRVKLPCDLSAWMRVALAGSDIEVVEISSEIAVIAANLPEIHRDPADRFIIATALKGNCKLMSLDGRFKDYEVLKGVLVY